MDGDSEQQQRKLLSRYSPWTKGFCSTSTKNPYSHVSPWFRSLWVAFHSKGHRDQKKGFFPSSQPPSGLAVKASGEPIFQLPLEGWKALLAWQHRAPGSWSSSLNTHSSSTFSFPDQDRCNDQKISECCDFCDIP